MSGAVQPVSASQSAAQASRVRPKLGFLGVGWIGRHRMKALGDSGECEIAAMVEPNESMAREALALAPKCAVVESYEDLLRSGVDGIVIATPSAMHAEQAIAALEHGISVFCQKPLGRNFEETQRVIDAAKAADRLLCVDLSYRFVRGIQQIRELVQSGQLGDIFVANLAFHNAYGPDKPWFYDRKLSGGGCLIDLGIHLVDLALWILRFPEVGQVSSRLFSGGRPVGLRGEAVEDYAVANLDVGRVAVQLACSWKAHAGCDAVIDVFFHGSKGGARVHNVNGSFFDFVTERFDGTARTVLSGPPEEWGGRAVLDWLEQLSISKRFNPEAQQLAIVAATLDRIYQTHRT